MKIPFLTNWRLAISAKWRTLGGFNRGLIMTACVISFSLSVSLFVFASHQHDLRNIKCLAMNVYHEARGEPLLGQYAVAIVTMNRVNSDRYPDDVCRVVYQANWSSVQQRYVAAFSWTLDRLEDIPENSHAWNKAYEIAEQVYQDEHSGEMRVKDALFYHADYVKPRWAVKKMRVAKIGRHIFYK
ncbi:MAG: cell wall hydrolase [Gammaproteobacteria bacterium]|nr:cell wall hydrolase [Gammaproteobacteria bacterium]